MTDPVAVGVILRTGESHLFTHGQHWVDGALDGSLVIAGANDVTIAVIARDRWDVVAYVYDLPEDPVPPPTPGPTRCPVWSLLTRLRARALRARAKRSPR